MQSLTNWKTSLAGLVALAIPMLNALVPVLPPQWAAVATGAVTFLGLLMAKDANVTGGTVQQ
jgi:hypothetical protein